MELEGEPTAADYVLQHIYGVQTQRDVATFTAWRFCLDMHIIADKFSEPQLSRRAFDTFSRLARSTSSADIIANIIEALREETRHKRLADELQRIHQPALLQVPKFVRACL